jgi:tripartite ATP-independent transporter DctP family solute receptor
MGRYWKFTASLLRSTVVLSLAVGATAASADSTTVLRFAHMNSPSHVVQKAGEMIREAVQERSGGSMEIQLFPSGQLGENAQIAEQISFGGPLIGHMGTSNLGDYNPDFNVTFLPFLFNDFDEAMRFMKTDFVRGLEQKVEERNLKVLCYFAFGVRDLYTRSKEVHAPADMKGLKVRAAPAPMYIELARQAFQAVPTPMPWPEVYSAFSVGLIDAAEAPPSAMLDQKHTEHAKFYMKTNHIHDVSVFATSLSTFNALSPQNQEILAEEAQKACTWITDEVKASYSADVEKVAAAGVTIIEDLDRAAFEKGAANIPSTFTDWTPGLYDRAQAELAKLRQ